MATTKRFEGEIPDGQHLDFSRDSAGAFRGTLRSNDDNKLVGHLNLREIEDDEDFSSTYEYEPPEDDGPGLGSLLAGLALVGLTVGAVAAVNASRDKKDRRREQEWMLAQARRGGAQPAVTNGRASAPAGWYDAGSGRQRWWDGETWTEHYQDDPRKAPAPPGWYDEQPGRQRWWDGQDWTAHFRGSSDQFALSAGVPHARSASPSRDVETSFDDPKVSMTSAEWQERVRAMLLARAFSEEQWKLLSHAQVEDADVALLEWQRELSGLTAQQFSDRVNFMLESSPALRAQAAEAASAGWYDDGAGRQRWWDGTRWTERYSEEPMKVLAAPQERTPAGWYDEGSGRQRWWDGEQWADHWA